MAKQKINVPALIATLVAVAIGVGLLFLAVAAINKGQDGSVQQDSQQEVSKFDFKPFSDASITKQPSDGAEFGATQRLRFEYDGSKSSNDDTAVISYKVYFIQDTGEVKSIGNGTLEGKGSGEFMTTDRIYSTEADGKKGFIELSLGQEKLGLYSITLDTSK